MDKSYFGKDGLKRTDRRYLNIVFSICLFVLMGTFANSIQLDGDFAALGIIVFTVVGAIVLGLISILLRCCGAEISKTNFCYTYVGTLNMILFLLFAVMFLRAGPSVFVLCIALIHLGLGGVIFRDIFSAGR